MLIFFLILIFPFGYAMYSHLHLKIYTTKGLERVHQNVGVTATGSQDREFIFFLPTTFPHVL